MPQPDPDPAAHDLRRRAELQLAAQTPDAPLSESDARRALHELQVHQVELQMQNEALQESEALAQGALGHLAELNRTMEQRIALRTAELADARDAAEAANRAKSLFLSNMSHELRTPMNGVMGMVELALARASDPTQIDWLVKARSSAAHLLSVINDILDVAKMEAGQLRIDRVAFSLEALLETLTHLLAPDVARRGLSFEVDLAPELVKRPLLGDAGRLRQILLNLAGNAVKFTDRGGVQLRVRLDAEAAGEALVRFEVQDSGIGIAAHDQVRLFSAFEQVENTLSRQHGGTGLGLAICKNMVQLMHGRIGLTSAPGAGSTFWFTVPLGWAEAAMDGAVTDAGDALAALGNRFAGTRILLAEDNVVNQEVVRGLLTDAGLVVDIASDGVTAVGMATSGNYALILMDLQMPRLDGIEATLAIRQAPGCGQVPIIALTASVFDRDRQRCLDAGMNDHIAKPLILEDFCAILTKWLQRV